MRDFDLTVKVKKADLLTKLKTNLEEHKRIYKESVEGFKAHAREQLEALLKRCDGRQNIHLSLAAPQDNSSEYTTIIGMLEMGSDEEIELSAIEYRKLVEDKWNWMEGWLMSNQQYSAGAVRKLSS